MEDYNYLEGYYFVYPCNEISERYLINTFGEDNYHTSDSGPFECGEVIPEDGYDLIIEALDDSNNLLFDICRISDRFETISEFIDDFWDGDTTEDDFYIIDVF